MSNLAVLGLQWGDEGKGKLIDLVAEHYDIVVRCQGGNNAGHTVQIGDKVYKLSLVPSGILWAGKTAVVGNGVVINPAAMLDEIDSLRRAGVRVETNLLISNRAHVVFPYHPLLERLVRGVSGKTSDRHNFPGNRPVLRGTRWPGGAFASPNCFLESTS